MALRRIFLLLFFCAGGGACGYHFPGDVAVLPGGGTRLHLADVGNRTDDPAVAELLGQAIESEVLQRGRFTIVGTSTADATLETTVVADRRMPVGFSSTDEALEYRTVVSIDATLRDTATGKARWSAKGLQQGESAAATAGSVVAQSSQFASTSTLNPQDLAQLTDVAVSESQEAGAVGEAVETLARDLYNAMVDDF